MSRPAGNHESGRGRDGPRIVREKERTIRMKDQTVRKTALVADEIKKSTEKAVRAVHHAASGPLAEEGAQVARVGHAKRGPVLAVGGALLVLLLARRRRVRR